MVKGSEVVLVECGCGKTEHEWECRDVKDARWEWVMPELGWE